MLLVAVDGQTEVYKLRFQPRLKPHSHALVIERLVWSEDPPITKFSEAYLDLVIRLRQKTLHGCTCSPSGVNCEDPTDRLLHMSPYDNIDKKMLYWNYLTEWITVHDICPSSHMDNLGVLNDTLNSQ